MGEIGNKTNKGAQEFASNGGSYEGGQNRLAVIKVQQMIEG